MYKVLVVDDKPSQVDMLCAMLTTLNIECIPAYSGAEAVAIARDQQPHLIIMDWIMPVQTLTGEAATRRIVADSATRHIPVIACSAASNLSDAFDAGVVDCIGKPFGIDTLSRTIRPYLN